MHEAQIVGDVMRFQSIILGVVVILLACASKPAQVVVIAAPRCDSAADDLTDRLREQSSRLQQALGERVRVETVESGGQAIAAASRLGSPRLVLYSGHGSLDASTPPGRANLCVARDHLTPERLLAPSRQERKGESAGNATLVLNACYSNYVDLRDEPSGVSIISSSFDELSVDSRFAEAMAWAVEQLRLDANCDGIVTDEELFNKIIARLRTLEQANDIVPAVELRAEPLLRRHARGQVPLPIPSKCASIRSAPLASSVKDDNELRGALRAQQTYARTHSSAYPMLGWDYFVVKKRDDVSRSLEAEVVEALTEGKRGTMLHPFQGTYEDAVAVAEYAVFTEVYAVEVYPPAIRIVRLRDDSLVGTRMSISEAVSEVFPFRDQIYSTETPPSAAAQSDEPKRSTFRIVRDSALTTSGSLQGWTPLPCMRTRVGECFGKIDGANRRTLAPSPAMESSNVTKANEDNHRGSEQ